jgi:hypothetical protein
MGNDYGNFPGWNSPGTGLGPGINPSVVPKQFAALAENYAELYSDQRWELQPACAQPYYGFPFAVGCWTGSYGQELKIVCGNETPWGAFAVATGALSGGTLIQRTILGGYGTFAQVIAGNPATLTEEWCTVPGQVTILIAEPSGMDVMTYLTLAPPSSLPYGATGMSIRYGYNPGEMQNDPIVPCNVSCQIAVDVHGRVAAYYQQLFTLNGVPLNPNAPPIQIPSQGLQ